MVAVSDFLILPKLVLIEFLGKQKNVTQTSSDLFIGRTDAKAETPILWPPDAKN